MDKFEILNRQTRDYNNRNCNPTSNIKMSGSDLFSYRNMETYKRNNGQYPYRPY